MAYMDPILYAWMRPITYLSKRICFYIHIDDFVSEQKGGAHMLQKQLVLNEKR